ncbi:polynucleotide adenylyltransferase PcnB [Caldichromatium japonicum]|uniref:Poly(A) polymerase I n=1 Tax=Caldichromatium japonicum TaxID=2699430 RepID=A0A6G7VFG0_9GAMM|nr:polynucleotide adenylyltransferase PcnB [Caldichromatium japonicum]QIK38779.1 polynucleotide adenylyltransferase PcnB [Caldichromatium japonicum]
MLDSKSTTGLIERPGQPRVIPRSEHGISRAQISEHALEVLRRLRQQQFQAHLVGGGVRDLLLGREPKDFDVVTDATPEQVRQVFRNCRLIGRRFRLAHVYFGREIVEVATFRGSGADEEADGARQIRNGMIVRDNLYGTIEEDALRRDFTINALYYDIADRSLIDYAGGFDDLRAGLLRLIGDPEKRYREDPVRMLRAVRFACKLGFNIEPGAERPLFKLGSLLRHVPGARLFDELIKLFHSGYAVAAFEKLRHYGLFGYLFPATESCLATEDRGFPITFVNLGLANTDQRIAEDKPVTPAFLYAILLWEPVRRRWDSLMTDGLGAQEAIQEAIAELNPREQTSILIPKRITLPMREIWSLQPRFFERTGKRVHRLLAHPRFRAAYDFLLLRAAAGEADGELAEWWTRFQEASAPERERMTEVKVQRRGRGRRRPRAAEHA